MAEAAGTSGGVTAAGADQSAAPHCDPPDLAAAAARRKQVETAQRDYEQRVTEAVRQADEAMQEEEQESLPSLAARDGIGSRCDPARSSARRCDPRGPLRAVAILAIQQLDTMPPLDGHMPLLEEYPYGQLDGVVSHDGVACFRF